MSGIKRVVNVSVKYIRPKYKDLLEWEKKQNHVYIGRQNVYVGALKSKWANIYPVKRYGLKESLKLYEKYVKKNLYDDLDELNGKTVGCWCKTPANKHEYNCHGDVLKKLLTEKNKVNTKK